MKMQMRSVWVKAEHCQLASKEENFSTTQEYIPESVFQKTNKLKLEKSLKEKLRELCIPDLKMKKTLGFSLRKDSSDLFSKKVICYLKNNHSSKLSLCFSL